MKKRLLSLVVAIGLVVCMAIPAMAAEINANEQGVLTKFESVVDQYASLLGASQAASYKSQARSALMSLDLSADEAASLSATIDAVAASLQGVTTRAALKAKSDSVVATVRANDVVKKYGIVINVDTKGVGDTEVKITNPTGAASTDNSSAAGNGQAAGGTVAGTSRQPVNQTGFDFTATYAVIAVLAAAFAAGIIISRKKLSER